MPCPFTPLLPLLASVPFLAYVRKKLGFFRRDSISDLCAQVNNKANECDEVHSPQWIERRGELCLDCKIPLRTGFSWDIFPEGAPNFLLRKALRIVPASTGSAQALLLPASGRNAVTTVDNLEEPEEIVLAALDLFTGGGQVSFVRIQPEGLRLRISGPVNPQLCSELARVCLP